jgi:hypothetical protein
MSRAANGARRINFPEDAKYSERSDGQEQESGVNFAKNSVRKKAPGSVCGAFGNGRLPRMLAAFNVIITQRRFHKNNPKRGIRKAACGFARESPCVEN